MVVPELPRRSGPQSSSHSQTESTENPLRRALKQSSSDFETVSTENLGSSNKSLRLGPVLTVMSPRSQIPSKH